MLGVCWQFAQYVGARVDYASGSQEGNSLRKGSKLEFLNSTGALVEDCYSPPANSSSTNCQKRRPG